MKYQVVIAGFGGQGSVFLVKVLALCAGNKNIACLGTENHGMSQRGGAVSCYIKIGDFTNPVIDNNQGDLIIGLDAQETLRNLHLIKEDGKVVANAEKDFPKLKNPTTTIDAFSKAQVGDFSIQGLNVYMLGIAVVTTPDFPFTMEEIKEAITQMNPKLADQNIAILDRAIANMQESN